MSQYVTYDEAERVISADYSNLYMTKELLEHISQEIVELARGLPHQVFAISCWKNTRFDPAIPEEVYASTTKLLLENLLGLVRYEVTNPFSSIFLRTQNVRNHFQGSSAMIFSSREEALAEVRRREQQEPTSGQ